MRIRGITFDLDGTLADTLPVCYAAFRQVFRTYTSVEYSDEQIHALFGPCEKGLLRREIPDWQPAFEMFLSEYERNHGLCLEPFPGIVDVLNDLAGRRIPIAIVTGKGADSAAISLRRIGLADRFEIVEAGSPEGPVKPEGLRRILENWKIAPHEAAHIGDAPSDIRSAREVGLIPLGAAWAPGTDTERLRSANPDSLFETVMDFRAWVDQAT